jgi:Immunity protein 26
MFQEGDIVEIPLPDGRIAIGRILHISQRTQRAIGFIVLGIKGQVREDVVVNPTTGSPTTMPVLGPLYTDIDAARHYRWKVVEHVPMKERDRLLTKRRVGDGVYVGDEFIGSVDELGDHSLKPMLLYGMVAVYNVIERAFGTVVSGEGKEPEQVAETVVEPEKVSGTVVDIRNLVR